MECTTFCHPEGCRVRVTGGLQYEIHVWQKSLGSHCVMEPLVSQFVRLQVLMVARMKMTAFEDIAPCSLIEVD